MREFPGSACRLRAQSRASLKRANLTEGGALFSNLLIFSEASEICLSSSDKAMYKINPFTKSLQHGRFYNAPSTGKATLMARQAVDSFRSSYFGMNVLPVTLLFELLNPMGKAKLFPAGFLSMLEPSV